MQSKINKNYSETFDYWEKVFFIIVTVYITSIINDAIKEYKEIGFAIVILALIAVLIIFGKKDISWNRFILDWVKTLKFYSI
ncbi:hypothetical protein [Clostridium beijerinckii]|uniref:hypothetical protein n=1 Tax=Clostridium beijerinckii TaxID=1520 RepID=UPI0012FD2E55|nr:hypothetical protein [Clostridium beijerinckii]